MTLDENAKNTAISSEVTTEEGRVFISLGQSGQAIPFRRARVLLA